MKSTRNFARHPFGLIMMLKSLIIRLSYRIFSDPNGYRRTRPSYFRHLLSLLTGGLNPRPMFRPVVPPDEQQFPITLSSRKTRIRYPIATCIALGSLLALGGSSAADPRMDSASNTIRRLPKTTGQWIPTAGPEGAFVGSIVASGANVFAGTSAGVFRSTDNGATWVASGLESFSVRRSPYMAPASLRGQMAVGSLSRLMAARAGQRSTTD